MNIILDKLPYDYEGLKINTDFRSFILFELMMQDNSLNKYQKANAMIELFYGEIKKEDIKKALDGIIWFYTLGDNKTKKTTDKGEETPKNKIYSYEYDAKYIYSAFKHDYNIDLNEIDQLHWWKF